MAIDYKRELEIAAKSMILVHEPDTLIRMIVRLMVQKVKVIHAGILLHDEQRNSYILRVSRGPTGTKVPSEFARMDYNNPLIRFFKERIDKKLPGDGYVTLREARHFLRKAAIPEEEKDIVKAVLHQMEILDATVCIPSYFQNELLGVLFMGKKKNGRELQRKELDFLVALAHDVAMAIRNARLFKQLQTELYKRKQLFINTTIALAAAIEAKDHYTLGHTQRVTDLSLKIGKRLIKLQEERLSENFLEQLHMAALLHDVGKIGIPESILNKEGPLTNEEKKRMQLHPVIGANILQPIKELEEAILGVKYHHERYDGKGYPEGLNNGKIPLIAAIIAVADTFDAMTTDRQYRAAMSKEEAVREIQRVSGQQLHPQIVSIFLQLSKEGKV